MQHHPSLPLFHSSRLVSAPNPNFFSRGTFPFRRLPLYIPKMSLPRYRQRSPTSSSGISRRAANDVTSARDARRYRTQRIVVMDQGIVYGLENANHLRENLPSPLLSSSAPCISCVFSFGSSPADPARNDRIIVRKQRPRFKTFDTRRFRGFSRAFLAVEIDFNHGGNAPCDVEEFLRAVEESI